MQMIKNNHAKLDLSERHKVLTVPDLFPTLSQQAFLEESLQCGNPIIPVHLTFAF